MNIIIIIVIIIIICLLYILFINKCKNKNKGGKYISHNLKDNEINLDAVNLDDFNKNYKYDDYEDDDFEDYKNKDNYKDKDDYEDKDKDDYEDDDDEFPTFIVYDIVDRYGDHHYIDGQLQYYINGKRDGRKATVNEDGSYSYESENRRYVIRNNNGEYTVNVYDNDEYN